MYSISDRSITYLALESISDLMLASNAGTLLDPGCILHQIESAHVAGFIYHIPGTAKKNPDMDN